MPWGSGESGAAAGPGIAPRLLQPNNEGTAQGQGFVTNNFAAGRARSHPAEGGLAVVEFDSDGIHQWLIERITVSTDNATPTTATVYLGSVDPQNIVDITPNGNGDIADEINPIIVPKSASVIIVWTGMADGKFGFARLQYRAGVIGNVPVVGRG